MERDDQDEMDQDDNIENDNDDIEINLEDYFDEDRITSDQVLYLDVNRLSGKIPKPVLNIQNIICQQNLIIKLFITPQMNIF
jgi:hypothetical protein